MNIENMTKLRDFLLLLPKKNFNHAFWDGNIGAQPDEVKVEDTNVCGTTACIGGWAVILGKLAPYTVNAKNEVVFKDEDSIDWANDAGAWLGLTKKQASKVFYPWETDDGYNSPYYEYLGSTTTNEEAAKFLTLCIKNKDVKFRYWKQAKS
jgi:hypothetical protein